MEKQLLAVGFENYSNYIKLPESVLTEFNKPKNADSLKLPKLVNKNHKSINLREQLAFTQDVSIMPPYYFSIESSYGKFTYCGVMDFTAEEGMVMIPQGVLANLDVYGSDFVTVRYIANVPKGDFVQLEPIQKEIFDIPELDKYLESVISQYCLLYPEQILTCTYAGDQFSIKVKAIKSVCEFDVESELIDIVNTDLKIDIFNRFLEEELREKERKRIEEEKIRKDKEEEERKAKEELSKQNSGVFSGTGMKLGGGFETNDPKLMREIRLQRLMALQAQNQIAQPVVNKTQTHQTHSLPDTKLKQTEKPVQSSPNPSTQVKIKPNKKPKDIEL